MSRNITWIREIFNNTNGPYTVWCWDTDNEGRYIDPETGKEIGVNDGGRPVTIKARQRVVTGGGSCGIPDGGDKDGMPKRRVFFAGEPGAGFKQTVGPRKGLRLNRTKKDDDTDQILLTNDATGVKIGRMTFPKGTQQTVNIVINPKTSSKPGVYLEVVESSTSTEAKWEKYVNDAGTWAAENLPELALDALKAAMVAAV